MERRIGVRIGFLSAFAISVSCAGAVEAPTSNPVLPLLVRLVHVNSVPPDILRKAQSIASALVNRAGISIEFRSEDRRPPCVRCLAVRVEFEDEIPLRFPPPVFAYTSLSRAGGMVHVFYRRVQNARPPRFTPVLLGYVLAHELAHVAGLEGHSPTGIMKAQWGVGDYHMMDEGQLRFSTEEQQAIRSRLPERAGTVPAEEPER